MDEFWGGPGSYGKLYIELTSSGDVLTRLGFSGALTIGSYSANEMINAAISWNSGNYAAAVNGKITTGSYTGTVGQLEGGGEQATNIGAFADSSGSAINSALNGYIYQIGLSDTEVNVGALQKWSLDPYSILMPAGLGG